VRGGRGVQQTSNQYVLVPAADAQPAPPEARFSTGGHSVRQTRKAVLLPVLQLAPEAARAALAQRRIEFEKQQLAKLAAARIKRTPA